MREKPLPADFVYFEEYHFLRIDAMGRTHFFPAPWYPVRGYSGLSHERRAISGRLVATVACPRRFYGHVDGIYKTLADFRVLISPDGVSQFRVVKQLLTSGLPVIRQELENPNAYNAQ